MESEGYKKVNKRKNSVVYGPVRTIEAERISGVWTRITLPEGKVAEVVARDTKVDSPSNKGYIT